MPSASWLWVLVGLLSLGLEGANGGAVPHYPHYNISSCDTTTVELSTIYETYWSESITTVTPTTVITTSRIEYTTLAPNWTVTVSVPVTVTVTATASYFVTIPTTIPITIPTTIPTTVPTTIEITTPTTIGITTPTTIPTTIPTTVIVPTTSYSTLVTTVTTSENPCPTTCSLAASTVRLFFWPTSNDYTYPSTYVQTDLDYTFTSPSVYIYISTIYGTNSLGRAGPAATNKVFPLDLGQVSTIVPGQQITQQLTLNDLYTNCPQSADPAVIATTIPDGHCDFSLVAPEPVKQWAKPCNACGRLGLFDPPYAIPPLAGGLIPGTTITTDVETTTLASITAPSSGPTTTIVSATTTTAPAETTQTTQTAQSSQTSQTIQTSQTSQTSQTGQTGQTTETETEVTSSIGDPTTTISASATSPTTVPTASATRVTGMCGAAWFLVSCFIILYL
ncbi:hypothetical protein F5Y01DRAFT_16877 [Xylaria sp. FL0043]|nr:hypothetical protein F5Y01DRAFT_16877 [Xylaria sp. FL0043]